MTLICSTIAFVAFILGGLLGEWLERFSIRKERRHYLALLKDARKAIVSLHEQLGKCAVKRDEKTGRFVRKS